ncbi:carbonic anhydrase [Paragonimus westermani]|uniref:carbonic anhydrase n=1 Tax=Paragonimus westermani TaxID=34504 RepID=A0A5J4N842_9TREM|nr:carbonic anhydrase [Paragonimus westermani]
MIKFPPDVHTVALNGDADETYDVLQMHFHWGSTNQIGTEHTVDGRTYALETHVVCYNNKLYKSPSEAAGSPSGLAVLAFLNKVEEDVQRGSTQIGILTGLEESIPKVGNPTQTTMIDPFDLSEILSQVQADEDSFLNTDGVHSTNFTVHGFSVMIKFPPDVHTVALNGDADETYDVLQMHFHWGSTNQIGTEHTVDGRTYALETHVVCYNNKLYKSPSEAAGSPSGLAVLAFLNKVEEDVQRGSTQIGILTGLEESIPKVGNPTQTTMIDPFDLSEILSQVQADEYYRYYGSLTTPPCTENVVWTVFRKLIPITPHQVSCSRLRITYCDEDQLVITHEFDNQQSSEYYFLYNQ